MISLTALALIGLFVLVKGFPVLAKFGIFRFVASNDWSPTSGGFGIFPMVAGTLQITLGALVLGVPLGIACATFLAEVAPPFVAKVVHPAIELLAGIPSVVYGFFGLMVVVPYIRDHFGGPGFSVLAGSVILAIMILPTVVAVTEDSLRAVPREYKEGSLALGATHWQTIRRVLIPAASSGIVAGVVLAMGRAVGETMAVLMVTGNVTKVANSLLAPTRTLTSNIALEMGYAAGDHQQALFATGIVLFAIIMLLNGVANTVRRKAGENS
jgi:phosphate transport system permease protein